MYPTVTILGSSISVFNLCVGIGAVLGILYFEKFSGKSLPKMVSENLLIIMVFSAVIGFACAILFNKIIHFDTQKSLFDYEGMSFLGGLLGGVAAFLILYRVIIKQYSWLLPSVDAVVPGLVMAHAFGRIGCFFGGCCYGKPCSAFGVIYPHGSLPFERYGPSPVFPVQLLESAFLILLFWVFVFILRKHVIASYLILYGGFRFVIEFFRGDDRGVMISSMLSPSQYISICMVIAAIVILACQRYDTKRTVKCPKYSMALEQRKTNTDESGLAH